MPTRIWVPPVLGAGTTWVITNDNPAAHDLIEFLQTPEAHETWMAPQGLPDAVQERQPGCLSDPTLRKMNEILLQATTFRFDGSDLMPGGVGAGSFWTGMVDYAGGEDAEEVADAIQKSWDALK
jgi:alpha-glucoside transport system substrate-binding protein